MAHWVGAMGQVISDKNAKACLHCNVIPKKPPTQNEYHFLI